MKVLVTGSQGFIGSYICNELLSNNYQVVGIDNFSKYGKVSRGHDLHPSFVLLEQDLCSLDPEIVLNNEILNDVDYVIAGAAMIGGITYFHKYAYDLLANNERILANTFDLAINLFKNYNLKKYLCYQVVWFLKTHQHIQLLNLKSLTVPHHPVHMDFKNYLQNFFAKEHMSSIIYHILL